MKRALQLLGMPLVLAGALLMAKPPGRLEAQWTCYDRYVLLDGRCPDACSYGELCPCIACYPKPQ